MSWRSSTSLKKIQFLGFEIVRYANEQSLVILHQNVDVDLMPVVELLDQQVHIRKLQAIQKALTVGRRC